MEELDPVFDRVAAYFRLLSEPMRLKVMHVVCQHEQTVSQIVEATGATQTNVSRHLNRMHSGGALSRRKEGSLVYYRVSDPELIELCRSVCLRIASEIEEQQPLRKDLLQLLPKPVGRSRPGANSRRAVRDAKRPSKKAMRNA